MYINCSMDIVQFYFQYISIVSFPSGFDFGLNSYVMHLFTLNFLCVLCITETLKNTNTLSKKIHFNHADTISKTDTLNDMDTLR